MVHVVLGGEGALLVDYWNNLVGVVLQNMSRNKLNNIN